MKKAIVFGATESGGELFERISCDYEIVAFCDNDKKKQGIGKLNSKDVIAPAELLNTKIAYDDIVIASSSSLYSIKQQLLELGIQEFRIVTNYLDNLVKARIQFLVDYYKLCNLHKLVGAVAEAGVFQGEFAKEINRIFFDRDLYLFDTFEGFDIRDIEIEVKEGFSKSKVGDLSITSEELVMSKMPNPDRCIIKKGYFPESARGLSEKFCFVNLDLDLYKPTLEGLQFFMPLMVTGGIILVHDYFTRGYDGVLQAVNDFLKLEKYKAIIPFPIGDGNSLAIQKV